jgi:PAS domain S-box-containing protein
MLHQMGYRLLFSQASITGAGRAESRARALCQHAPDMCFVFEAGTGRIVSCNRRVHRLLGYSEEQIAGRPITALADADSLESARQTWRSIVSCAELSDVDLLVMRRDGSKLHVSASVAPVADELGRPWGGLAVWRDISRRKRAEAELAEQQSQLRTLAYEICMAEERERRRIATGLHDEIGQLLVVAKLKLGELRGSMTSPESRALVGELRGLLDQASCATRSATFELSSVVLHKLGLEAAIESLTDRMARVYGLRVRVVRDQRPIALAEDKLIVLFRAVRELLFNVHKHARAGSVVITVRRIEDQGVVRVEDDGVGFEVGTVASQFTASGGFGLFSVSAQLQAIGGQMDVRSVPGVGTKVALSLPLAEPAAS